MPAKIAVYRPPGSAAGRAATNRAYERSDSRKADRAFYNSAAWRRVREYVLMLNPLCARCDRPTPAVEVHHLKPRDVFPELSLDPDNCQGLCRTCHRKARPEDAEARASAIQ